MNFHWIILACHIVFLPLVSLYPHEIEYSYLEASNSSIHIIEVDPSQYEIKPVKALDNGIGRESVLSMSRRYGAVASINGGFFSIGNTYDGKPSGALKIHEWYALPCKPRGCIGWSMTQQIPIFDRLSSTLSASDGAHSFSLSGLNRPRKEGETILFTPPFHRTTLTQMDGQEIIIKKGVVQAIVNQGSTHIPKHGQILSIQKNSPFFNTFCVGMPLTFSIHVHPLDVTSPEDWESLDYIVGGTPLLLHPQIKMIDFTLEQTIPTFLSWRHARTAVGILPNGHWLFVVVDKTGFFDGMTMLELAHFMEELGCVYALNLDGGGSSTMVYKNEIKNTPWGDEDEDQGKAKVRRVSDAILIFPKF